MGYGSYKAADWAKLRASRGINQNSGAGDIFKGNQFNEKYDPRFINMRESCDSSDSPRSTPVILGFDVTGSMGYLAAEIAKNSLNKTITQIYDKQPVTNPHVMCAAFTGEHSKGAVQATQFEADIRVVEQLLELKVGFGWNSYSYDMLVWYLAARHTRIDSFDKRGKKGFIFCIGDEICQPEGYILGSTEIEAIFKDKTNKMTAEQIYKEAAEKYEISHIITGDTRAIPSWNEFMPGRVAYVNESRIEYLSEVITSLMQLAGGSTKEKVISQWENDAAIAVAEAVDTINPVGTEGIINKINEPVKNTEQRADEEPPKKKSISERLMRK